MLGVLRVEIEIKQEGHTDLIQGWDAIMYMVACEWVADSRKMKENHLR